jgi:hypothetical protein
MQDRTPEWECLRKPKRKKGTWADPEADGKTSLKIFEKTNGLAHS